MDCLSSLYDRSKHFTLQLIHPFTHIHTLMAGAATQGANLLIRGEFNHSFSFIHRWRSNGRNSGLSVLPKDTSTCGLEELGIEPRIFQLEDDRSTAAPKNKDKPKPKSTWQTCHRKRTDTLIQWWCDGGVTADGCLFTHSTDMEQH